MLTTLEDVYGRAEYVRRFDPLDELVSCILSQHTTDATSYPTFEHLRRSVPAWDDVEALGVEGLAEIIRPAGLALQKARSIVGCLKAIRERFGSYSLDELSVLSDDEARAILESLPGVGPKTAAIVLCFAFGRDVVPVDTHVYRVSWRLGFISEGVGEAKAHPLLDRAVPKGLAFRFHMALIAHGRATCRARNPACVRCVVAASCRWRCGGASPS